MLGADNIILDVMLRRRRKWSDYKGALKSVCSALVFDALIHAPLCHGIPFAANRKQNRNRFNNLYWLDQTNKLSIPFQKTLLKSRERIPPSKNPFTKRKREERTINRASMCTNNTQRDEKSSETRNVNARTRY